MCDGGDFPAENRLAFYERLAKFDHLEQAGDILPTCRRKTIITKSDTGVTRFAFGDKAAYLVEFY